MIYKALLLSLLFVSTSYSQRLPFEAKTDDLAVDDRCEEYLPNYFIQERITYFTVGSMGATKRGFDEEVPVERSDATTLWKALSPNFKAAEVQKALTKVKRDPELTEHYNDLLNAKEIRGATYQSEGEVLENLSYEHLPYSETFNRILEIHFGGTDYDEEDYFLTGGVSYANEQGRILGELDVIVGDAKTCTIFAIGEAKLGRKRNKALKQLARIRRFLKKF